MHGTPPQTAVFFLIAVCAGAAAPAPIPIAADGGDPGIVEEVRENILHQPVGAHTVSVYNLPESLVRRLADRIIQSSFQEQFRMVVVVPERWSPPPTATRDDGIGGKKAPAGLPPVADPGDRRSYRLIYLAAVALLGVVVLVVRRKRSAR